jgi:chromosome condensin MukBEF MukE localization factor|tara:strand:+ start:2689 stop:2994 length:306 start_codon:yes stop_codon:yes gene_type:complete
LIKESININPCGAGQIAIDIQRKDFGLSVARRERLERLMYDMFVKHIILTISLIVGAFSRKIRGGDHLVKAQLALVGDGSAVNKKPSGYVFREPGWIVDGL